MASKSRTAADRQRAADIRDWAAANGLDVKAQGRIPVAVESAYDAAMTVADDPAEPGPNWADAGIDGLDLDAPEPGPEMAPGVAPGAWAAAPPAPAAGNGIAPVPEPATAPPPPASLDDARERLGSDSRQRSAPPWAGSRGGGGGAQRPAAPVTPPKPLPAATVRDIEGKLALLLAIPVAGWEAIDPYCGGAASEALPTAVKKAVPVIAQSETAMRWLAEGGGWILALDLLVALMPTARAVYQHHWAHSVMIVNGRAVPAARDAQGHIVPAADVPAPPPPDWSAYTTDVPGHVPPVRSA